MALRNIPIFLKSLTPFALLILLVGCSSPKTEHQDLGKRIPHSVAAPGESWEGFWESFTTALHQNETERVSGMAKLPLFINMNNNEDSWNRGKFVKQFEELFNEKTKNRFSNISDRDIQHMPSNDETSKFLHAPVGIELKSVTVYDKSDGRGGSSKTFFFGQMDGAYKLMAVVIAG